MRFIAGGTALAIMLTVTGCGTVASSPHTAFDPSQGTPTDKVRWGIQFASENDTKSVTAAAQAPDVQASVVESMGQAVCRGLDATAATMGNGVKNLQATIDGLAVSGKLGQHDAIVFTAISVTAYCPKCKAEFDALMTANKVALRAMSWTPPDNQYGGPISTAGPTPNR